MHALVAHNTHDKQRCCEAVQGAQHSTERLRYHGVGKGRHLHPHSPLCTFRNNISKLFQVETRASVNISKNTANIS